MPENLQMRICECPNRNAIIEYAAHRGMTHIQITGGHYIGVSDDEKHRVYAGYELVGRGGEPDENHTRVTPLAWIVARETGMAIGRGGVAENAAYHQINPDLFKVPEPVFKPQSFQIGPYTFKTRLLGKGTELALDAFLATTPLTTFDYLPPNASDSIIKAHAARWVLSQVEITIGMAKTCLPISTIHQ